MEQARPSSAAPTDGTSPASGASRSREAANPGGTRLLPSLPPPDGGARLLPSETSAPNTPEETKTLKLKTQNSIAPALLGNALARSLIHAVTDAIIATDPAGYILFMNPAAEQMCGASSAAVAGLHIDKAFPLTDPTTQTKIATPLTELLAAETIQKSKFKIQNSV
ncbi:MAG TPA: PAS domain-containing protein, partial [Verrucomicrobiae bacterium]